MKALVYHGPSQKAREDVPDAAIREPTDVVVKVDTGTYEQAAHVTGDQEYRAVIPFPATVVPSQLVTIG